MSGALAVVVPTLGRSPALDGVLGRLERQAPAADRVLVAPRASGVTARRGWRWVEPPGTGFARAVNAGLAAAEGDLVAVVNDDALPKEGWLETLIESLARDSTLAAVQGVHLQMERPALCDGCGIAWNRRWQAVQILHACAAPPTDASSIDAFGVSATAAIYRRSALDQVALDDRRWFDERLESWYEDVELAVRLRSAGWRALCVPSARVLHGGSTTGRLIPLRRARLLARNRWWVAARLLGRRLQREAWRMLVADWAEARNAARSGHALQALAWSAALAAALPGLPRYLHRGPALDPGPRAEGFSVGSRE